MWPYCTPSWLWNILVSDKPLKTATTMHMAASLLTSVKVLNSGFWIVKGERTRGRVCLHVWCHEEIVHFIYYVRRKQISNFKVAEILTPSDKCSVSSSTSIVCDSDEIVFLHNPQIHSENTTKLSQQIWVQISTNYGAISLTLFLLLVRGSFRKSNSRANTNTFHSKVVAHFLAFPWSKLFFFFFVYKNSALRQGYINSTAKTSMYPLNYKKTTVV